MAFSVRICTPHPHVIFRRCPSGSPESEAKRQLRSCKKKCVNSSLYSGENARAFKHKAKAALTLFPLECPDSNNDDQKRSTNNKGETAMKPSGEYAP